MIQSEMILRGLETRVFGKKIFSFDSIDSTNSYAKSLSLQDSPHGSIIIAEEQSAGRGRLQRNWLSAKGENLLFSIVLRTEFSSSKISLISFAAALAVCDAVESVTMLPALCKWPNDVMVNGKKVCGMLLESTTFSGGKGIDKVVVGIGVNVNQTIFPEELTHKATSLRIESGREIDRIPLLQKIITEFELRYQQLGSFPHEKLLQEWKMKSLLFGEKITVLESEFSYTATAVDVNEDGSLLIRTDDGHTKKIFAGDVSLAYY